MSIAIHHTQELFDFLEKRLGLGETTQPSQRVHLGEARQLFIRLMGYSERERMRTLGYLRLAHCPVLTGLQGWAKWCSLNRCHPEYPCVEQIQNWLFSPA